MDVNIKWNQGMELTGEAETGHTVIMDAAEAAGGQNKGFRPTALIALGAAGCSSMDVLSILRKKKVNISAYECKVNVESYQESHPHVFTKMHLEYIVTGKDIKRKDVERAVELSETKYCQGIAMMKKTAEVTHTITIIEE